MGLSPSAQRAVLDVDPDVPAYQVMPMERATGVFARFIRSFALLLAAFGAFALLLSAVGVYGVVSYAVGQRRQEIGIRMAIGAQSRDVLALVMRQGMRPVLVGVVLGVAGSLALTRALRMLLYGVTSSDFLTFGAVVTLLTGVAALANYLPAVRATRLDPLVALRE